MTGPDVPLPSTDDGTSGALLVAFVAALVLATDPAPVARRQPVRPFPCGDGRGDLLVGVADGPRDVADVGKRDRPRLSVGDLAEPRSVRDRVVVEAELAGMRHERGGVVEVE